MVEPGTNFQNQLYQDSHQARTVQIPTGVASRLKNSRQTAWFCRVLFTTPDKTLFNEHNTCHNLPLQPETWRDIHYCNQFLPSPSLLQLISLSFQCFKLTYAILFILNNAAFVLNGVLLSLSSRTLRTFTAVCVTMEQSLFNGMDAHCMGSQHTVHEFVTVGTLNDVCSRFLQQTVIKAMCGYSKK